MSLKEMMRLIHQIGDNSMKTGFGVHQNNFWWSDNYDIQLYEEENEE